MLGLDYIYDMGSLSIIVYFNIPDEMNKSSIWQYDWQVLMENGITN